MKKTSSTLISIFGLMFCLNVQAKTGEESVPQTDKDLILKENVEIEKCVETNTCSKEDLNKLKQNLTSLEQLKETFKFGIGIGFERYKDKYITEAETVGAGRIVKVSDSQTYM